MQTISKASNESSNAGVGLLRTMERQLIEMSEDSDKVAENFSYFKTNIGALGTWLATAKQQPLAVDYLGAGRAGEEWPAANAGWFASLSSMWESLPVLLWRITGRLANWRQQKRTRP